MPTPRPPSPQPQRTVPPQPTIEAVDINNGRFSIALSTEQLRELEVRSNADFTYTLEPQRPNGNRFWLYETFFSVYCLTMRKLILTTRLYPLL